MPPARAAGLLVIALSVSGAGCGGGVGSQSQIAKAASETKHEGTATYSVLYKEAGRPAVRGSGAVDFASYRGKSVMYFGGGAPYRSFWDVSGVWASTAGITLVQGNRRLVRPSQHWVKAPAGLDFQLVGPLKMLDVARAVALVSAGKMQDLGGDQALEHWKGSVPFDRFVKLFLPPSVGKPLLHGDHPAIPVEAWVTSTSLIRRLAYAIPALAKDASAARATFRLGNFGKPVDVEPPPADDVIDVRTLDLEGK